jgi:hypothetical protein
MPQGWGESSCLHLCKDGHPKAHILRLYRLPFCFRKDFVLFDILGHLLSCIHHCMHCKMIILCKLIYTCPSFLISCSGPSPLAPTQKTKQQEMLLILYGCPLWRDTRYMGLMIDDLILWACGVFDKWKSKSFFVHQSYWGKVTNWDPN